MWSDYKSSYSRELNKYFNSTEIQNRLAAANTTPLAVMRNVISVAEKAQKIYFQSIAAKKNEANAREIFASSMYDAPKKYIISIL